MNKNQGASGGIGAVSILGIVFIVLKLCHIVKWSWLWVLIPFWVPATFLMIGIFIFFVLPALKLKK